METCNGHFTKSGNKGNVGISDSFFQHGVALSHLVHARIWDQSLVCVHHFSMCSFFVYYATFQGVQVSVVCDDADRLINDHMSGVVFVVSYIRFSLAVEYLFHGRP